MTVLRESPWYTEIVKEGIEQGIEKGIEQGIEKGSRASLLQILKVRFGEVPRALHEQIKGCDRSQLEALMAVALQVDSLETFAQEGLGNILS
ncbi:MAG: DUF4351 domain-containing protein [Thermosynechococcaceae cyanobacterium]